MFIKTPSIYTVFIEATDHESAQWLNLANVDRVEVLHAEDQSLIIKVFWSSGTMKSYTGDRAITIIEELKKTEASCQLPQYQSQDFFDEEDYVCLDDLLEPA